MAAPQSVAEAQAQVSASQDRVTSDIAAENAALTNLNTLIQARQDAYNAYLAAAKANGGAGQTSNAPAEYAAYQAAKHAATDAQTAYQDAVNTHIADAQILGTDQDTLTTLQKQAATASQQTAATANATAADDTARAPQTKTDPPLGDQPTPVTTAEQQNIKQADASPSTDATASQPVARSAAPTAPTPPEAKTDVPQKAQKTVVGDNQAKTTGATPNPLDAYSSYTYSITLHVLTREDYNTMVKAPHDFKPTKTLISSAGRYPDTRDPAFKQDFYFEDLKFDTIIGMNANSRGTNVLAVDFTIIEPYGMTLLDRIMDVNNKDLNGKNYLDMPYLLEISFFGYDDTGKPQKLTKHTKWVPLKLTGFKIKASIKGAEYAVSAVPFNHSSNFDTVQSIKTRMHVTAATVDDYFSSSLDATSQTSADSGMTSETNRATNASAQQAYQSTGWAQWSGSDSAKKAAENAGAKPDSKGVRTPDKASDKTQPPQSQAPTVVNTNSFVAAWNYWYQLEVKRGNISAADEIQFVFHDDDLKTSKIVDAKKASVRKVAQTDAKTAAKSQTAAATTTDFDSAVYDLEAGTSVNEVVNLVLPQSQFFLSQVKDGSTEQKAPANNDDPATQGAAKPVKMWKIIPSIELLSYDNQRNTWAKRITFNVVTYLVYQKRDDRLDQSPPPKEVKRYDYFYTGHNSSVISFDIDFNALYFTAISVDRGAKSAATGQSQKDEAEQNTDSHDNLADNRQIGQERKEPQADSYTTSVGGASSRSETQNAKSVVEGQYTSAAGDMINLKMQIIGDPEFIKQDDLFIAPTTTTGGAPKDPNNPYVPGTQSLDMDSGEIYCYVTFRTPSDFNDTTGMYDLNSKNKYSVSEFSGYYKVIKVSNEFKGGKFTQNLEMIRYPKQDPINKSAASSTAVVTDGEKQRENPDATSAKKAQQTANPAVVTRDVMKPAADTPAPPQPAPAAVAATGADNDAATNASPPSNTPVVSDDTTPTADQQKLADVANNGNTVAIGDAAPATGDPVVAPTTSNTPTAQAQQTIADARAQIATLQSQSSDLTSQITALRAQNDTLNDQADALAAIDNPTAAQKQDLKNLENQINSNSKQVNANLSQIDHNASQMATIATTANNATFDSWSSGVTPIKYDLNGPVGFRTFALTN